MRDDDNNQDPVRSFKKFDWRKFGEDPITRYEYKYKNLIPLGYLGLALTLTLTIQEEPVALTLVLLATDVSAIFLASLLQPILRRSQKLHPPWRRVCCFVRQAAWRLAALLFALLVA